MKQLLLAKKTDKQGITLRSVFLENKHNAVTFVTAIGIHNVIKDVVQNISVRNISEPKKFDYTFTLEGKNALNELTPADLMRRWQVLESWKADIPIHVWTLSLHQDELKVLFRQFLKPLIEQICRQENCKLSDVQQHVLYIFRRYAVYIVPETVDYNMHLPISQYGKADECRQQINEDFGQLSLLPAQNSTKENSNNHSAAATMNCKHQ